MSFFCEIAKLKKKGRRARTPLLLRDEDIFPRTNEICLAHGIQQAFREWFEQKEFERQVQAMVSDRKTQTFTFQLKRKELKNYHKKQLTLNVAYILSHWSTAPQMRRLLVNVDANVPLNKNSWLLIRDGILAQKQFKISGTPKNKLDLFVGELTRINTNHLKKVLDQQKRGKGKGKEKKEWQSVTYVLMIYEYLKGTLKNAIWVSLASKYGDINSLHFPFAAYKRILIVEKFTAKDVSSKLKSEMNHLLPGQLKGKELDVRCLPTRFSSFAFLICPFLQKK